MLKATDILGLLEGVKGKAEFEKMKKYVNDMFIKNTKFKFKVKEYPSVGSFFISGDSSKIMEIVDAFLGDSVKVLGNYGYSMSKLPNGVVLKNFDMYTDAAWKRVWKS
jgi:hypothetical protein